MGEYVAITLYDAIDLYCLIAPPPHTVPCARWICFAGRYQRQRPEEFQLPCCVLVCNLR